MKKSIFITLSFLFITLSSQAQFTFGAGASYITSSNTDFIGVQAKAYYGVNETWDVSPAFTYWVGDGLDWSIDADLHYKLLTIGESFDFNPFGGLTFLNGGSTELALNIGGSFKFALDSGSVIYVEPKFIIIDNDSFVVSAGYLF